MRISRISTYQYSTGEAWTRKKVHRFVQQSLPSMDGKRYSYHGWEGRLVLVEDSIFFMKKRAKTRGYRLTPAEALLISLGNAA